MEKKNFQRPLLYHLLVYVVLWALLAVFSSSLILEDSPSSLRHLLLLVGVGALGHLLILWKKELAELAVGAFFMADAAVIMVLVRASGSSTSPFLVLFPLLVLAASVLFSPGMALIILLGTLTFQVFSIGFAASILGNALATIFIAFLGLYLNKALRRSGALLKVSEGHRKRLENLQKAILANIPSGLMSVDSQGRVIQVNEIGMQILDRRESSILMKPLKSLLPGMAKEVDRLSTLLPVLEGKEDYSNRNRPSLEYESPKGKTFKLGYSVARLSDPEDGSVLGSLVVFQDLTQIVKMEETLRTSQKLAAVGKLAGSIAHEIRNPLASISGSAQLLEGAKEISEEDKRLLRIIQRESSRLDVLITEFLEYVRAQKPKMEAVTLSEVVNNLMEVMSVNPKWQGLGTRLKVNDRSGGSRVLGDANKITQCLMNLVLNSGQAGASEVLIEIEADGHLSVIDDGSGIEPDNQKQLFEPFFTTKETGTGLGLATSYRILNAMGARISVVSPVPGSKTTGGGTLFKLEFKKESQAA